MKAVAKRESPAPVTVERVSERVHIMLTEKELEFVRQNLCINEHGMRVSLVSAIRRLIREKMKAANVV